MDQLPYTTVHRRQVYWSWSIWVHVCGVVAGHLLATSSAAPHASSCTKNPRNNLYLPSGPNSTLSQASKSGDWLRTWVLPSNNKSQVQLTHGYKTCTTKSGSSNTEG